MEPSNARPVITQEAKVLSDVRTYRRDFPILRQTVNGKPLVYLDNAATTQKPRCVIERIRTYYEVENSNIHRGIYSLSERATDAFEKGRETARAFLNARTVREIVFVRGTTEGINLVSNAFGKMRVGPGDEVIISAIEHHSNIVPWQALCKETGARLRVIPVNDAGELDLDAYEKLLSGGVKMAALTHVSNALGTVNPVKQMIQMAHRRGVPVLVDGAQAVAHMNVDVADLDCDFYVFSGHKLYGPTGIGVVYGREDRLEEMTPYQYGGDMIRSVSFVETQYAGIPYKFEAGTPDIAGVIGLGAALEYVQKVGLARIEAYEKELLEYGTRRLQAVPGLRMIGTAREKTSVMSFVMDDVHAHDVGTILDQEGVAVRAGHHCAMPVMDRFKVAATTRASLGLYNTKEDLDALIDALSKVREIFGP